MGRERLGGVLVKQQGSDLPTDHFRSLDQPTVGPRQRGLPGAVVVGQHDDWFLSSRAGGQSVDGGLRADGQWFRPTDHAEPALRLADGRGHFVPDDLGIGRKTANDQFAGRLSVGEALLDLIEEEVVAGHEMLSQQQQDSPAAGIEQVIDENLRGLGVIAFDAGDASNGGVCGAVNDGREAAVGDQSLGRQRRPDEHEAFAVRRLEGGMNQAFDERGVIGGWREPQT